MKIVSFKKLKVPQDVKQTEFIEMDIRKQLGNHIFKNMSDMSHFKLAEKIYDSGEKTDIDEQEELLILDIMRRSGVSLNIQFAIAKELGIDMSKLT